mgnify:FL=1
MAGEATVMVLDKLGNLDRRMEAVEKGISEIIDMLTADEEDAPAPAPQPSVKEQIAEMLQMLPAVLQSIQLLGPAKQSNGVIEVTPILRTPEHVR